MYAQICALTKFLFLGQSKSGVLVLALSFLPLTRSGALPMSEKKPFEVARETLKQLALRKLPPTPLNYKSIYNQIAGIPAVDYFPTRELQEHCPSNCNPHTRPAKAARPFGVCN